MGGFLSGRHMWLQHVMVTAELRCEVRYVLAIFVDLRFGAYIHVALTVNILR